MSFIHLSIQVKSIQEVLQESTSTMFDSATTLRLKNMKRMREKKAARVAASIENLQNQ